MPSRTLFHIAATVIVIFTFTACGQNSSPDSNTSAAMVQGNGIEVDDAWARPGMEGRMSAAYFLITNYTDMADTLVSVETEAAETSEVHESYEREEGMMGMRAMPELELPSQSTVRFEQGGLHVMLMELNRQLAEGDSLTLTLNFKNNEPVEVDIPVRM